MYRLKFHLKTADIKNWLRQIEEWKIEHPLDSDHEGKYLTPQGVIQAINQVFPEAIITTEVGQNQMWAALYYDFKHPRTFLTSGGLGTMGYGFPAAIGAQTGNRKKKVIDIAGDGSIQMNIQELATAVIEELPVIVAILNNSYLGMVRQWQELFCNGRYSSTCLGQSGDYPDNDNEPGKDCPAYIPDFVKLAEAYNAIGLRVKNRSDVIPALEEAAKSTKKPVLIDFLIEKEANVWPMVPPGAGIDEMIFSKEDLK